MRLIVCLLSLLLLLQHTHAWIPSSVGILHRRPTVFVLASADPSSDAQPATKEPTFFLEDEGPVDPLDSSTESGTASAVDDEDNNLTVQQDNDIETDDDAKDDGVVVDDNDATAVAATDHKDNRVEESEEDEEELWRVALEIGVETTITLLKALRWGLAQALTASLPSTQKDILLDRLQRSKEYSADDEEDTVVRGSVAEEATVTELASANNEAEIAELREKLKAAVADRVQSELDAQQYRLATEQVQQLESEKDALNQQIQSLTQSLEQANDSINQQQQAAAAQEDLKSVEELLQKRLDQQAKLEIVEKELHERAQSIQQAKKAQTELQESVPRLSPKEYRSLSEEEKADLKARREAARAALGIPDEKPSDENHPVLGPVIADLGYKRIHLISSGKLGTIPIWEKQRTYRNSRAKSMAADKEKSMDLGFPGIICLYEDENGALSILDGQHRVGMMQALKAKRNGNEGKGPETPEDNDVATDVHSYMFDSVLAEVYIQPSNQTSDGTKTYAEQVFLEINKAEPVKLIDMPGVASAADRRIISEAVDELQRKFPRMFSPSQRNRVPNVNVDNLRNAIYGANVLRRHKITTSKKLFDWLLVQNASLGAKYEHDEDQQGYVSPRSLKKASTNGFYLGLDSSWLYA